MVRKALSIVVILLALSSGLGVGLVFLDTARNLSLHVSDPMLQYELENTSNGYELLNMVIRINLTIENNGRAKLTSILATIGTFFTSNSLHERIWLANISRPLGTVGSGETKTWAFSMPINSSLLSTFMESGMLRIDFLLDAKVSFGIQTAVTYLIPIEKSWDPPE